MKNYFDDSLRKKWESFHFPVNEDHRAEMAKMLDQPRRRRGIFWWVTGLGLSVMSIAIFFQVGNQPKSDPQYQKPHLLPGVDTSIREHAQFQERFETKEKDNLMIHEENDLTGSGSTHKVAETTAATIKSFSGTSSSKRENSIDGLKQRSFVAKTGADNATDNNPSITSAVFSETPVDDHSELLLPIVEELRTERIKNFTEEIATLPLISLVPSERSQAIQEPVVKTKKPFFVFAETGGEFLAGAQNSYSTGHAFNVGAGIQGGIVPGLSLFVSGGYQLQQDGFEFERTSTVNEAGFGARSNFHSLTPDQLHFVYSNIGLEYQLKRNVFQIAAGLQYLYGARGWLTVQTQDQLEGYSEGTHYSWLNLKGMNRALWNGTIRYGYRVSPRITALGGVKYNFSTLRKVDQELSSEGFYWDGLQALWRPSIAIKYFIYGK